LHVVREDNGAVYFTSTEFVLQASAAARTYSEAEPSPAGETFWLTRDRLVRSSDA
jgi:hypothetical protein